MKSPWKQILAVLAVCLPLVTLAQTPPAAEPAKPADTAAPAAPAPAPAPAPAASGLKLTWYGIAHTAVYASSAAVSSSVYAGTANQGGGRGEFVLAANASRLGVKMDLPEAAGAKLGGVFEMDFRGGWAGTTSSTQNPSGFYNSLMRIRKAYGSATWATSMGSFGVGAGQEFTIVAPLAGVSTVYLADQLFTNAGNPNRRTPQIRFFGDLAPADDIGVNAAIAVVHPVDVQSNTAANEGQGVKSRMPDLEGRVGFQYKMDKKPVVDVGVGYFKGKERFDIDKSNGAFLDKSMLAIDAKIAYSIVLVQGEWFTAKNADSYFVNFATPSTGAVTATTNTLKAAATGGFWGQLVLTPIPLVQLYAGFGQEKPKEADLAANSATAITKNTHTMAGLIVNPSKNWQAGLEVLMVKTERGSGTATASSAKANQIGVSTRFYF